MMDLAEAQMGAGERRVELKHLGERGDRLLVALGRQMPISQTP